MTKCKREAQLLDAAERLGVVRRRRFTQLVAAIVAFVFVPSLPSPVDLVAFLVILAIAGGAVGFLAGTIMARSYVSVDDLTSRPHHAGDDRLSPWPTRYLARSRIGL